MTMTIVFLKLLVQPFQQVENFRRRLCVQVAGRLVGDDQRRVGGDGAGDGDALLLPPDNCRG